MQAKRNHWNKRNAVSTIAVQYVMLLILRFLNAIVLPRRLGAPRPRDQALGFIPCPMVARPGLIGQATEPVDILPILFRGSCIPSLTPLNGTERTVAQARRAIPERAIRRGVAVWVGPS